MYSYKDHKSNLFTEQGQVMFLNVRDKAMALISEAGAVRLQEAISGCTGDSWDMLACVDRLVELGEIREVTEGQEVVGQHRVFVKR